MQYSTFDALTVSNALRKLFFSIIIIFQFSFVAIAQNGSAKNNAESSTYDTFEFVNQEIRDIVYILSLRSGKSIICDDTVSGKGNFLYVASDNEKDFEDAFDAFLYSNKLLVTKKENLWTVSKIKIEIIEDGKINLQSYDSTPSSVFEKLSEKTGKSIIYETLPMQKISLHIQNKSVSEIVSLILQPYSDYSVNETSGGVQILRKKSSTSATIQNSSDSEESVCNINYAGGKYDVGIKYTKISEVLQKIFFYCGESYSDFLQNDEKIKSLSFESKSLEETLILVLEQINAEPVYAQGIWYIFPKNNKTNSESVLARIRNWNTLSLKNLTSAKIIPFITSRWQGISVLELSSSCIALYSTQEEFESIKNEIKKINDSSEISVIKLKYIKTGELINVLPPLFSKEEISDTGTGNSFFFTGSTEKKEKLVELLSEIDVPKKLVRYDLLIIQYEKSSNLSWGASTSVRPTEIGDRTLITGEIGNLLNINFDAITAFGLTFSEKINTAIQNNEASVFADTTLYGLSGEKITFKNTNTYRYKDAAIDSQSGKESFSTITREITSGLVLEIDGWVSGDDIITMQISTSVSKQGVDVSKKNGNPPPTSEKNITTKIRAKSGEPVVLSGLSQSDSSKGSQGVPVVSKIPVLGNLFKSKDESNTKTEMTIYLLPHIEETSQEEGNKNWKEALIEFLKAQSESAENVYDSFTAR